MNNKLYIKSMDEIFKCIEEYTIKNKVKPNTILIPHHIYSIIEKESFMPHRTKSKNLKCGICIDVKNINTFCQISKTSSSFQNILFPLLI